MARLFSSLERILSKTGSFGSQIPEEYGHGHIWGGSRGISPLTAGRSVSLLCRCSCDFQHFQLTANTRSGHDLHWHGAQSATINSGPISSKAVTTFLPPTFLPPTFQPPALILFAHRMK
jgi:hypothetical protein